MCAGADSIDDVDVVRSGGMKTLFGGVYAPSTIGTLLREFSFGHARQLESVLRAHLGACCVSGSICCPAPACARSSTSTQLLRPVYGQAKQGACYRAHQDRRQAGAAQGAVPVWSATIGAEYRGTGDRGDAAARGQVGLRARARPGWWPKPSPPRGPPGSPGRSWCAATRPTAPLRWWPRVAAPMLDNRRY